MTDECLMLLVILISYLYRQLYSYLLTIQQFIWLLHTRRPPGALWRGECASLRRSIRILFYRYFKKKNNWLFTWKFLQFYLNLTLFRNSIQLVKMLSTVSDRKFVFKKFFLLNVLYLGIITFVLKWLILYTNPRINGSWFCSPLMLDW